MWVYDENNHIILQLPIGSGPNDGLKGYTGSSVSIRLGDTIFIYNERGNVTGQVNAR